MATSSGEVTRLLARMRGGDQGALGQLMPVLYKELLRIAGHYMRAERKNHTLQPTALVHEAYLRLVEQDRANWQSRAQFMAVAGQMMRRILVNHAVRRKAYKRARPEPTDLNRLDHGVTTRDLEEILAVDEVLTRLRTLSVRQARVVEMRYFAGLTIDETAEALDLPCITVKRDWAIAKAWLQRELSRRELT